MVTLSFSPDDETRIAAVLADLDPARHELLADCSELLEPTDWALLTEYARARLERALRLGLAVRAVVSTLDLEPSAYAGKGTPTFARDVVAACAHSFEPIPQCWRLAPLLEILERGREGRVDTDIRTLEVLAEQRLFGSDLDEGLRALLG